MARYFVDGWYERPGDVAWGQPAALREGQSMLGGDRQVSMAGDRVDFAARLCRRRGPPGREYDESGEGRTFPFDALPALKALLTA
jgi:hypothetical protein